MKIYNDIIVDGIDHDFVTLLESTTGFYNNYGGAWFSDTYEFRVKNSKNQTISLSFECFDWNAVTSERWWNVVLSINSKRNKGFQQLKQTGKAGLESLVLTKKLLKHFINNFYHYVPGKYYNIDDRIFVWWDDSRRRDVYKKYLADIGFVETYIASKDWKSGKCLMRCIDNELETA